MYSDNRFSTVPITLDNFLLLQPQRPLGPYGWDSYQLEIESWNRIVPRAFQVDYLQEMALWNRTNPNFRVSPVPTAPLL